MCIVVLIYTIFSTSPQTLHYTIPTSADAECAGTGPSAYANIVGAAAECAGTGPSAYANIVGSAVSVISSPE